MKRNDQAIFHDYASSWWDGSQSFQRLLANLVKPRLAYFDRIAPDWDGLQVLDLGCGGGFMAEALARRGARVTGIDPISTLLETAREHARAQNLDILYREGRGEAIPMRTGTIDRVVCMDVLEHVEASEKVVAEIRRVLRPHGMLFFSTVNRNWLSSFLAVTMVEDILQVVPRGAHDPEKFIRPIELCSQLQKNGLTASFETFRGIGPTSLDRRLDFVFGLLPVTWVMYLGFAAANG